MSEGRPIRRIGAIDVGTNSIRLLVADVSGGPSSPLATVSRAGEPCRLGRGLDRSGMIDLGIAERAAEIVSEFVRRARGMGAKRILIGATAAIRSATNGQVVAELIGERSGHPVRVLSGEEEARLVYEAVVLGLGTVASRSPCVVFDIGGGSTEVVSGLGDRAGRWTSLAFGAVSLTERHLTSAPPPADDLRGLLEEVEAGLAARCASMPDSTPLLAGVGGTVTALAALDRGLKVYEPSLLEGWMIPMERLEALVDRVIGSTPAEMAGWPVMGEGRADIVVAGAVVVRIMARRFPSRGLVCSTQGLRYGLARLASRGGKESS